jgi:phage/plasmid primase-like uncharacterized protein
MSFFDDQEDDWFANDCKGSPDDYYAGELAPWRDGFTDTSAVASPAAPLKRSKSKKRREQRKRSEARKKAAKQA